MEPLPIPSCSRPAEIWSRVVAIFASTTGWMRLILIDM